MEGIKKITVDDFSTSGFENIIKVYSKFGLIRGKDDNSNDKLAIINCEKGTFTKPFVDEVIYSSVPLRSWTENYIVVRIGEKYYLADCDGNCFLESTKPPIICRNGFVSREGGEARFINNKLEYRSKSVKVYSKDGCNVAYYEVSEKGILNSTNILGSDGSAFIHMSAISSRVDFSKLPNYCAVCIIHSSVGKISYMYIINKNFDGYHFFNKCILEDEYSITYRGQKADVDPEEYYSAYLGMPVSKLISFPTGNGEKKPPFSIVNAGGKTHIFYSDGRMKSFDTMLEGIKVTQNRVLYRDDNEIVEMDLNGVELRREELSPKELYFLLMNDKND